MGFGFNRSHLRRFAGSRTCNLLTGRSDGAGLMGILFAGGECNLQKQEYPITLQEYCFTSAEYNATSIQNHITS